MGAEPTFQEPDVLLPVHEAEIRRKFAIKIESEIRAHPKTANFKLNAVQVAIILFVPLSTLRPGGYLSSGVLSEELHQRLVGLQSLVKHYLNQLLPYKRPYKRPEHPEERKCTERDGNVCVLMGTSKPWAGHIVPYAWNDTQANIQKTEKVFQHIQAFFGRYSLLRYRLCLLNPRQPGSSDRVWNMLCLKLSSSCFWRSARLAFKCLRIRPTTQGESVVILQLHWMPWQRHMEPTKEMSLQGEDNDFDKMIECAKSLHSDGGSNLIYNLPELAIPSGHLIHVRMPNSEAVRFKAMVDLQWAMIVVAAFSGANAPLLRSDYE